MIEEIAELNRELHISHRGSVFNVHLWSLMKCVLEHVQICYCALCKYFIFKLSPHDDLYDFALLLKNCNQKAANHLLPMLPFPQEI